MLSQAEIDALLSGSLEIEDSKGQSSVNLAAIMGQTTPPANEAEKKSRDIKLYNFWSPDHFSKDQMRAVELVHEDLAERLTSSLPTFLRTSLRPRVVHTEQGRFHDFINDLPGTSLFHMINLAPLPGQMVLTISPDVSYVVLEQRLGGQSKSRRKNRALTEIDQSLLRGMVEHMLNDIKASWSKVVAIEPGLEDSTINQHWVQMVIGNERVMLITFELTMQDTTGTMNIYIPFTMLKPIANVLNPHAWFSGRRERQGDPDARAMAMANVSQINFSARVYLGSSRITIRDFSNLKPGDILPLTTSVRQDLPMYIDEKPLFWVKIGKKGKRIAAQIVSVIRIEEDQDKLAAT